MIAAREHSEYLRLEREHRERFAVLMQYALAAAVGIVILAFVGAA